MPFVPYLARIPSLDPLNKSQAIASSILGAELDVSECEALAERMGVIEVADGETLVAEGER